MRLKLSLTAMPRDGGDQVQEFIFDDRGGVIGRGDDCNWRLDCPDKLISRRHCAVTFEDGAFHVYDASANGVFVNDSPEPLGQGYSHRVADGDSLRLGDFVISAEILDAAAAEPTPAAPADGPSSAVPAYEPPLEVPAAVSPAEPEPAPDRGDPDPWTELPPLSGVQPVTLGHPNESFSPPSAHIPEDWNLELSDLDGDGGDSANGSVGRLLDALEPATTRALLEGMGIDDDQREELTIEAPTARALGELLSACVESVMTLQAEHAAVERRLSGRSAERGEPAANVAGYGDARAYLRALLAEHDRGAREAMTAELMDTAAGLQGRHRKIADVLVGALGSVIEQFAPHKGEARARRRITEVSGLRRLWRRLRYWKNPAAECWRRYCSWYEGQGGDAHRALNKLFEKKAAALYAQHLKPVSDGPNRARETARRRTSAPRSAAAGGGIQG